MTLSIINVTLWNKLFSGSYSELNFLNSNIESNKLRIPIYMISELLIIYCKIAAYFLQRYTCCKCFWLFNVYSLWVHILINYNKVFQIFYNLNKTEKHVKEKNVDYLYSWFNILRLWYTKLWYSPAKFHACTESIDISFKI